MFLQKPHNLALSETLLLNNVPLLISRLGMIGFLEQAAYIYGGDNTTDDLLGVSIVRGMFTGGVETRVGVDVLETAVIHICDEGFSNWLSVNKIWTEFANVYDIIDSLNCAITASLQRDAQQPTFHNQPTPQPVASTEIR